MKLGLALLAGTLAASVGWSAVAGADAPSPRTLKQVPPPAATIPAKVDCRALVQDGFTSNSTVPDFQDIPGAPTRITSAVVVPATATQPEYCDVSGYVQSQIRFQLKLPTTTWQGRYWQGCSDGGREGLMEAQRYPDDFDGIVVGAPALFMEFSPLFLASAIQANTGGDGNPILTLDKLAPLHDAVVKACDRNDGVTGDGLIGDPRDCNFDPASIRCPGADGPACLTAAQVSVVRTIYAGARDRFGRQLDPRMTPRGSELTWAGWWVPAPPPVTAPAGTRPMSAAIAFGESAARWLSYPLGQGKPLSRVELSLRDFAQMAQQAKYYDAVNPNLEAFRRRGGKLMLYQGLADALVPPSSTLEYFNAVRETMGGPKKTDRFARLFLINGMNHCMGGPTPNTSDLVLQMVRWVENGAAPESITARPLTVAKYAEVRRDDDVEWVGDYLLNPRRSDDY